MNESATPVYRRPALWLLAGIVTLAGLVVMDCVEELGAITFSTIEEFDSEIDELPVRLYDQFRIQVHIGTRSKDFPASLYSYGIKCSANYVGKGVILTAAHCFHERHADKEPSGQLYWNIKIRLSKDFIAEGRCERPNEFKEGEANARESVKWDWALCAVDKSPTGAKHEVISIASGTLQEKMELLLTGFGVDHQNKVGKPGMGMRVGKAHVTNVSAETVTTCGSSVDDGDSGAGTYIYFDEKAKNRVQVAVNSRKNDGECDPSNSNHRSSTMLGLWRADDYINNYWRTKYKRALCGVHIEAANCRGPSLSTVTPGMTIN